MYDTVIFDLDGTLLYTLPDLTSSVNYALTSFGYPKREASEVSSFLGDGNRKLIERSLPQDVSWDERVFNLFFEHYLDHSMDKTIPYPGIREMLKTLREKGVQTAVVSNKNEIATKKVCDHYFGNLLDLAFGDNGTGRKPDPVRVLEAMEKLHAKKCLYVGDLPVDMETAANAAADFCFVTWGFASKDLDVPLKACDSGKLLEIILNG